MEAVLEVPGQAAKGFSARRVSVDADDGRRFAVEPNTIDTILLSHLHGDHFGGIPFFILDAQLVSKRIRPLVIAGPVGTKERIHRAMEVLFPGSSTIPRGFKVEIVELEPVPQQAD